MRMTEVENGKVRGIACGWPSITAYYGIPYGAPPVGELRWRAPRPAADWEGVRDCARPSAKCPQLGVERGGFFEHEFYPYEEEMSEDCLYLNVWTPAETKEERLPVIFWVHGGAFMTGYGHSAHFDGEHFARQGVILVTINYRLNVFGWMVHEDLSAESEYGSSGNYGLLDQIAALKWVRRNISAFGGDPDNITIAGQSAGAACVQALICSPLTKGLFQKAILQSGGGPAPFPDMEYPSLENVEKACDLTALGVSTIEEARSLPAMELLNRWKETFSGKKICRTPVIDGYVLPEGIVSCYQNGHTPQIPCLIGYTSAEGLAFAKDRKQLETVIKTAYGEKNGEEYLALCPKEEGTDGESFGDYQKSMATEMLQAAAESCALIRQRQGKGETYVYCLERDLPGDDKGAFHAADLWYVFRTLMRSWRPWEAEDYMIAYGCNTWWANFAKKGTPNGDRKPELPLWTPFTEEDPKTMEIDRICAMGQMERNPRVSCRIRQLTEE